MKKQSGLLAIRPAHAGLFIWCALAPLFYGLAYAQSPQLGAGQVLGNATAARRPAQASGLSALFDRAFCPTANATIARISGSWVCLASANNSVWVTNGSGVPSLSTTLPSGLTIPSPTVSSVTLSSGTVTGVPNPSGATDAANKSYVDSLALGLNILGQTRLATAAVLPNTPTYANGASGVGATLTAGSNTTLTVDATVAALNDIVLVKNQAAPAQNGQYYVSTAGSGGAAWVLTRCTAAACGVKFDDSATMLKGSYTFVSAGTTNAGSSFALTGAVASVGTTAVTFSLFSQQIFTLPQNQVYVGSAANLATGVALSGDCTIVAAGAITCTKTSGISFANIATSAVSTNLTYTAPGTGGTAQSQASYNQNILWAKDYGALCNGATETTAFQNLINSAQTLKSPATFKSGSSNCISDSLVFTSAVTFGGANGWSSVLQPVDNTHDLLSINTTQMVTLSDFRIDYLTGSGTAITCAGVGALAGDANEGSILDKVRIDTPGISLKLTNCKRFTLRSSYFNDSTINNVLIDNPVSCDSGDNHFGVGNTFVMSTAHDSFKVNCGGGENIIGNKFHLGASATAISYSLGASLTNSSSSAHIIQGNSIENGNICITFNRVAGTGMLFNVNISGNELVCRVGVYIPASGISPWMHAVNISNMTWHGTGGANNLYVLADGVYGLRVGDAGLWATGGNSKAVSLGSQIAGDSTVGPFAKANDGGTGGSWAASDLGGGALTVTCSATCY